MLRIVVGRSLFILKFLCIVNGDYYKSYFTYSVAIFISFVLINIFQLIGAAEVVVIVVEAAACSRT